MKPDKRKPEDNPWYLLATLHGEALSADDEVHALNRTAWNRFMAAELTEDTRAFLLALFSKAMRFSSQALPMAAFRHARGDGSRWSPARWNHLR
jgi:hypothetical protein